MVAVLCLDATDNDQEGIYIAVTEEIWVMDQFHKQILFLMRGIIILAILKQFITQAKWEGIIEMEWYTYLWMIKTLVYELYDHYTDLWNTFIKPHSSTLTVGLSGASFIGIILFFLLVWYFTDDNGPVM